MLIDVPVTICFDTQDPRGPQRIEHTFTMRYETDDTDKPAQWCRDYPPDKRSRFYTNDDGLLFDLLPRNAEKVIAQRAARSPIDYCADEAEGEALQNALDEARAQDGAFGAGA
jgi:hypothetical protein